MCEAGGDLYFTVEPFGTDIRCQVRVENLDGDGPPVLEVLRQVHGGHSPATDLGIEPVAVGQ